MAARYPYGDAGQLFLPAGRRVSPFPFLLISGAVIGFRHHRTRCPFFLLADGRRALRSAAHRAQHPRYSPAAADCVGVRHFCASVHPAGQLAAIKKHMAFTSFAVCGLLVGSLFPRYSAPEADLASAAAVLLGVAGAVLSWYLLRRKEKGLTAKRA